MLGCRSDYPLSHSGAEVLRRWGARFDPAGLRFYMSPALRCRQSAAAFAEAAGLDAGTFRCAGKLREVDLGLWDGREKSALREGFPLRFFLRGCFPGLVAPPGGQRLWSYYLDTASRVRELVEGSGEDLLLVTHAGVIRALHHRWGRAGIRDTMSLPLPYGSLSLWCESPQGVFQLEFAGKLPEEMG